MHKWRTLVLSLTLFYGISLAQGPMAFTVSMPQPSSHIYHVTFRCEGLKGELQDFKMPKWSPGFYGIGDYARFVSNFHADDASGHSLAWEMVASNAWRVIADNAPVIVVQYDVFSNISFAANNYLGEDRGYLSPAALFMNLAGQLRHPVTIEIQLPANWARISTGLEPVTGKRNTFEAADFDILYDSPILAGNQESYQFDVRGVQHQVVVENVAADVDRGKMVADLKTMVTAATHLMGGEVPYRHYTFLLMGLGRGGIEHSNSSSNQFDGKSLSTPAGYLRWLSFICHEYFHAFNVKRIRPLALGPFDYDQENLTRMLWVSEGLSVYYQDLVLVRAGLMTRDEYLAKMGAAIGTFENATGRRYQSATESSWTTWSMFSGVGGDHNTTISYYNNGAMLGAMLDLGIRASSGNRKSLDDVMRALYRTYYQEKKRGFTDAEFRAECDKAAGDGSRLDEVFSYASTSREIDYAKYFALAGLNLEVTTGEATPAGGYIGLDTRTEEIPAGELPVTGVGPGRSAGPKFRLVVTEAAPGSPAALAGLQAGQRILEVDAMPATSATVLNNAIEKKIGQRIKLVVADGLKQSSVEVEIVSRVQKKYLLTTSQQNAILESWLSAGR